MIGPFTTSLIWMLLKSSSDNTVDYNIICFVKIFWNFLIFITNWVPQYYCRWLFFVSGRNSARTKAPPSDSIYCWINTVYWFVLMVDTQLFHCRYYILCVLRKRISWRHSEDFSKTLKWWLFLKVFDRDMLDVSFTGFSFILYRKFCF